MNRKQLILLLALGAVLGGLGMYFYNRQKQTFQASSLDVSGKLLGDLPVNDVAQLAIKQRDGEVNLVKQDVWVVKERFNYPASFSDISEFLRKAWELKPVQSQQIGSSHWSRLDLLTPGKDAGTNTATLVELKDKEGKPIRSLLLGKKAMRDSGGPGGGFPVGRFVALPDNPHTVFVVNEAFNEIEAKPENWVNKDFFKVEKLRAISLVSTNATNSWKLNRTNETSDWVLVDAQPGEQLDKGKTSSFNWALSSPTFNDVQPADTDAAKAALAQPTTLTLETFENFTYTVNVGTQPDADSFHLAVAVQADLLKERAPAADEKPEDKEKQDKEFKEKQEKLHKKLQQEQAYAKWLYTVSKWTVDSVLKDRSALLAETKPTSTNAPPAVTSTAPPTPPLPGPLTEEEKDDLNELPNGLTPPAPEPKP